MVHSTRTVLIVDDSAAIRRELSEEFMRSGFAFCEAENGSEAIERVRALSPDLIILDLSMPVMNGLEAAPRLREILPHVPIILYTAFADAVRVSDFHACGVTTVFPKSDPLTILIATAEKLLDHD
jgi:CheY-like chemotaxis protein